MSYADTVRETARLTILRFIEEAPGHTHNVSMLTDLLQSSGITLGRDQVVSEVLWLQDAGLVKAEDFNGFTVVSGTAKGMEIAMGIGDKIRPAEEGEVPFGVISANPSVVGDADIDRWMYKYLTDDFGSPILEDYEIVDWDEIDPETGEAAHHQFMAEALPEGVTVPQDATRTWRERRVLNPEWDPDHKYVPRRDRAEWDYVGLMGKLRLRKGQPVAPGWIKMKTVSQNVEQWLVK